MSPIYRNDQCKGYVIFSILISFYLKLKEELNYNNNNNNNNNNNISFFIGPKGGAHVHKAKTLHSLVET